MKGNPDFPQCGFSGMVVRVLDEEKASYHHVDVLQNESIREGIKSFSKWPTIPQLYVGGEFVGGCDIVVDLYRSGELKKTLDDANVARRLEE
mmetsp:Transcript_9167/g.13865  ORF Transcript_9167/g.13865 Transcript_9167/m.13865 type:complete len:92 (-) Transcript_9167:25-300(-)